jgi:uncharacterized protein (TIGR02147 family)
MKTTYTIQKLNDELNLRQRSNTHYSLRAFARDLSMHPSTLSAVLNGSRKLPLKNLKFVIEQLELSPIEETLFREGLTESIISLDKIKTAPEYLKRIMLDESNFKVLSQWEHYGILSLIETDNFVFSIEHISKRLGITPSRVQVALKNLEEANLVTINDNKITLNQTAIRTTEDISSRALRLSHQEAMEMGIKKIESSDIEKKDFSTVTIAINPKNLPKAKTIIREFRQKMASLLREGHKTEVYQMAIQLYPLTSDN